MKVFSYSESKSVYLTLTKYALICAFAAVFTAVCARVAIRLPFTPVPITLQVLAVIACGLALGSRMGAAAQVLYLVMGAAGLPVFAEGKSTAALLGPTSGYLYGFVGAAYLAGFLSEKVTWKNPFAGMIAGGVAGIAAVHICGVSVLAVWLTVTTGTTLASAYADAWVLGSVPFILIDLLKAAAAALLADTTRKTINAFIG